ncbi:MAG: hypothetical protein R6X10_04445 [Desulfobacterales bacterium]
MLCDRQKTAGIRLNYVLFFAIFLQFFLAGCGTEGDDYSGNFATGITPEIIDAALIDENGDEIKSQVINGNPVIMLREGQKIGFEIVFRTSRDVIAEVIVSQYTPMDLLYQEEPVYCDKGLECPDPEKGEIPYYGEELYSGTPYYVPQRFSVPTQPEGSEEIENEDYDVTEEAQYNRHYLKIRFFYTMDQLLGYDRMFRFQVEDSAGYISRHLIIYTKIPL